MKITENIKDWWREVLAISRKEVQSERAFFWMLTIVLSGISIWAAFNVPELQVSTRLIPFFLLMALHLGLHWLSPGISMVKRGALPYLALQGAIAFVLGVLAPEMGIIFGLYMALIGEAVGILRQPVYTAVAVVIYLLLSALSILMLSGTEQLMTWIYMVIPTTVFVVIYVSLYSRQAEAKERAQKLLGELEIANKQLEEYAGKIEQLTLTNERQRMARELHDTLAQGLAGLILQLEAADSHFTKGRPEKSQLIIQQAMERARATLADSRRVIDDLRTAPAMAKDFEFLIRNEVDRLTTSTGIPCQIQIDLPSEIPELIREHALRFVVEGLTNIARHAKASRAWVKLGHHLGDLLIEIGDDGIGFDSDKAIGNAGHYGLMGMRERARQAGGTLEIASSGQGSVVTMCLPLDD